MFRLRSFRDWLSLTLVFSIGIPWLPLSTPPNPIASSTRPAIAQTAGQDRAALQRGLDLIVSQAVSTAGWSIDSVSSQLDEARLNIGVEKQAGSGTWTIQAHDATHQAVSISGSIDFDLSGTNDPATMQAAVNLKGSLSSSDTSLSLTVNQSASRSNGQTTVSAKIEVNVTRNGQTHATKTSLTSNLQASAYGLNQSATHVVVDRDGQSYTSDQSMTARNFGSNQTELWLQSKTSGGQGGDVGVQQHAFTGADQSGATVYYDQYQIQVGNATYHLKSPATANATYDGQVTTTIDLVDQQGNSIGQINTGGHGALSLASSHLNVPPLKSIFVTPFKGACADAANFLASVAVGVAISLLLGAMLGNPVTAVAFMWALIGAVSTAGIGLAASHAQDQAGSQAEKDAINEKSFIVQVVFGLLTGTSATGALTNGIGNAIGFQPGNDLGAAAAGAFCNGDPYFIYHDVRSISAMSAQPINIIRVSGGLISPTASIAANPSGPTQPIGNTSNEYMDRPELFIGGSIPSGATSIGTWNWDTTRVFGAAASHTAGVIDGTSKQYFIHAANPLNVTADDNIVQYVYLDPKNPPEEILLQLYTGDGDG